MMFPYLLKVSACIAIFFIGYRFLFARLTFFKLNRAYLLLCLLLSFVIPALSISHETTVVVHKVQSAPLVQYSEDNSFEAQLNETAGTPITPINWAELAINAYFMVAGLLLLRHFWMMWRIQQTLKRFPSVAERDIVFVDPSSSIKNCSFLTRIIVDASLSPADQALVIKHESIHVLQWHALDKLLVNLCACILWFNPLIYLWRNAIDHNHEFLADEATAKAADKKAYASLLLNLAMPSNQISIHHFSKLPLKNRIAMMYQKPNPTIKQISYFALFPLVAICCIAFINQKDIRIQKTVFDQPGQALPEQVKTQESKAILKPAVEVKVLNEKPAAVAEETVENANVLPNRSFDNGLEMNLHAENALDAKFRSIQLGRELILVVDAGHGGRDGVASGVNGEKEKDLNLRAVTILKEEADKRKIKVVLTRSRDEFVVLRDRLPAEEATAFISIHHNSLPVNSVAIPYGGIEAYVAKNNVNLKSSERFAVQMLSNLGKLNGVEVRQQLKSADLLLLRESKVPAVILELGNMRSAESMRYLKSDENIRKICNLILDGFIDFSGC